MKRRILSALLVMVMIMSMLPNSVFAASTAPAVDGTYTDGVWAEGGDGTITHDVNGTQVTLSKTAKPVEGDPNSYDITLEVRTSTSVHTETNSGSVVLVIDVSGSMDYCANCGRESKHSDSCSYRQEGRNVKAGQRRIDAAKAAARIFLENYAGKDPAAVRLLSIVTFARNGYIALGKSNVAGGAGYADYDKALATINGLSANGGTNLEDGLYQAYTELRTREVARQNVVLLTDGAPTYSRSGGNGTYGSESFNAAAKNQADAIKAINASLYTVCFGAARDTTYKGGPTVGDFLSGSIASSGCAYNADDATGLYTAFAAITQQITAGLDGSGLLVEDPMAAGISVTSAPAAFVTADGKTYQWELADAYTEANGSVTHYVYTLTYRVKLDVQMPGFEEGKLYPTNENTYLVVDGVNYAFPVPGVTGVLPRTSVTVTKAWDDDNNRDNIRTESVTLQLTKDGVNLGEPVTIGAAENWTYTWTDLIEMSGGVAHDYSVVEVDAPAGYTPVVTKVGNAITVTNTHIPEKISISGSKTWDDNNNQDGIRPESITIKVLADGVEVASKTVTAADNWAWTFENLLKYRDQGTLIQYTVTETTVDGYTTTYDGYNVTNSHTPAETSVAVSKNWADNNNQDGIRTNDVTVKLLANGKDTGKTLVLNAGNGWAGSFAALPVYENGNAIVYTVEEIAVPGYTTVITGSASAGFVITNTHTPETVAVSGSKTWEDQNNQDGTRPASITINLLADGVAVATKTVTEADGWAWNFENLPKFANGSLIVYSITEEAVEGYVTTYNGFNVTNTHAPEKTSITVTKTWADSDNQDGIRPNDITVVLVANGKATEQTLVLSSGNGWTGSFANLDKYKKGEAIVYTVQELTVEGYTTVITGDQTSGYTITNTHTAETLAVSGSKTWVDNDNQDGARPESITIHLLANGIIVDTKVVTEADGWAWTFENLPKYEKGVQITYTITEEAVEDYSTAYDGFNVINTHTPAQTSITVSKSWQDNNDQDGIRPNQIVVVLLANGEQTNEKLTLSVENNWTGSFTELPKFANGEQIVYTVSEITVEGYETVITGDQAVGFTITNSHTPEVISISGSKTWDDKNNQDGKRPESITIHLMANGTAVQTVTVTEAEGWAWTFENLPKYEKGGVEIVYAITEDAVEGYTTVYNGYDVTNSYTPTERSVTVTKAWADSNDADGLRPDAITITLYANGELTDITLKLTAKDNWSGSFVGLPKYANGVEIVYTIGEVSVKEYNTVIRGNMTDGFVVTNSRTPIPPTGDDRAPMMWTGLIVLSALVVMFLAVDSKKRRIHN